MSGLREMEEYLAGKTGLTDDGYELVMLPPRFRKLNVEKAFACQRPYRFTGIYQWPLNEDEKDATVTVQGFLRGIQREKFTMKLPRDMFSTKENTEEFMMLPPKMQAVQNRAVFEYVRLQGIARLLKGGSQKMSKNSHDHRGHQKKDISRDYNQEDAFIFELQAEKKRSTAWDMIPALLRTWIEKEVTPFGSIRYPSDLTVRVMTMQGLLNYDPHVYATIKIDREIQRFTSREEIKVALLRAGIEWNPGPPGQRPPRGQANRGGGRGRGRGGRGRDQAPPQVVHPPRGQANRGGGRGRGRDDRNNDFQDQVAPPAVNAAAEPIPPPEIIQAQNEAIKKEEREAKAAKVLCRDHQEYVNDIIGNTRNVDFFLKKRADFTSYLNGETLNSLFTVKVKECKKLTNILLKQEKSPEDMMNEYVRNGRAEITEEHEPLSYKTMAMCLLTGTAMSFITSHYLTKSVYEWMNESKDDVSGTTNSSGISNQTIFHCALTSCSILGSFYFMNRKKKFKDDLIYKKPLLTIATQVNYSEDVSRNQPREKVFNYDQAQGEQFAYQDDARHPSVRSTSLSSPSTYLTYEYTMQDVYLFEYKYGDHLAWRIETGNMSRNFHGEYNVDKLSLTFQTDPVTTSFEDTIKKMVTGVQNRVQDVNTNGRMGCDNAGTMIVPLVSHYARQLNVQGYSVGNVFSANEDPVACRELYQGMYV
jgi:hypothetical protein